MSPQGAHCRQPTDADNNQSMCCLRRTLPAAVAARTCRLSKQLSFHAFGCPVGRKCWKKKAQTHTQNNKYTMRPHIPVGKQKAPTQALVHAQEVYGPFPPVAGSLPIPCTCLSPSLEV